MELIQIIILVFCLFALSRVLINVRHRWIARLEGIFWIIFWAAAIFAVLFPSIIVSISEIVSAANSVNGVTSVAITSPLYNITNDLIEVGANEKAKIHEPTTDVIVSVLGT